MKPRASFAFTITVLVSATFAAACIVPPSRERVLALAPKITRSSVPAVPSGNDGRGERLAIDAFVAREAEREKAVAAVAALPVVKAYCAKIRALKLGCLIYFDEGPSDEGCGPSPPLDGSCWNRIHVGEAHESRASRFGTFLVAPGTSLVVGASGYCDAMPIAQFHGSGSGCPK